MFLQNCVTLLYSLLLAIQLKSWALKSTLALMLYKIEQYAST